MKYTLAAAAVVAVSADAPPAFNEPPFAVKSHPSASGLVQVGSACAMSGAAGVMCEPASEMLFATGMNGDEDLGQDITMKGQKFHYNQQALFATGMNGDEDLGQDITMKGQKFHYNQAPEAHQLFATGMNGDEDLGQDITMKGQKFHYNQQALFATGMNGDEDLGQDITMKGQKFHYNQAPAAEALFATGMNGDEDLGQDITMKGQKFHYNQQALFATGMNGDEDLGQDITMKGQKFHYAQEAQPIGALIQLNGDGEAAAIHKADWTGYTFPDKVHTIDPKEAKTHTAFYAQQN
jgi:hypothetical protein